MCLSNYLWPTVFFTTYHTENPALKTISYKSGYKYQLSDNYIVSTPLLGYKIFTPYIRLYENGRLTILSGYCSDGPSGPAVDTKNFMRGAFVHDALYQLIREGHLPMSERLMADKILRQICREDGMSWVRAWWVFQGVHLFASGAASPRNKRKVHTAP